MTPAQRAEMRRVVRQLHAFLQATDVPGGIAVVSLIAASAQLGQQIVANAADPERERRNLLAAIEVQRKAIAEQAAFVGESGEAELIASAPPGIM